MKTDIYTLAHEIKNPLCVVKGYLEMMKEDNYVKYKEIINKEIDTSLEILNNYLEYNKLIINKEEIDLNVLLLDIKDSMKEYLISRDVHLIINLLDEDIYLLADYNKLKQVFYNIIKNSVEWQAKVITVTYQNLHENVKIMITNDGEKIDEDKINHLDEGLSFNVLGNGIGLSLSKKIIELHHGTITYVNNLNKGISTIITLNKR